MRQNDTALDFSLPSQIHKIFGLSLQLLYTAIIKQRDKLCNCTGKCIIILELQTMKKEERREEGKNVGRKEIISRNNSRCCKKK